MESIAARIFRFLAEHPTLCPANYVGEVLSSPEERNGIGILFYDPAVMNRSFLKRLFLGTPGPEFLGVLFFYSTRGLGDWTFKVTNKERLLLTRLIAEELRQKFNVDVRVSLCENEPGLTPV